MSKQKLRPFVYLVAVVAAMGGLAFGFDIGGSGGTFVMKGFREHFGWGWPIPEEPDSQVLAQEGWINALFTLGALVGAVPAGSIADFLGRRVTIMMAAGLLTIAAIVQAAAVDMTMMYVGRVLCGVSIGMESAIVPVYISECAPEHFRGELSTMWQLAVTVGIVVASIINIPLSTWEEGWRISYGGNIVFSVVLLLMMVFVMPESPRWLVARDKREAAAQVLAKLRFPQEVEPEVEEIQAKYEEERSDGKGSWLDLLRSENRMGCRTALGVSVQAFQQLTGINAIMFFAPAMLSRFFSSTAALYGTLAINIVNHLGTYITFGTVDRLGRVTLLVISGAGMCIALLIVGGLASMPATQDVGVAVIALSCVFVVFFAFGWGPVAWTVCSEMYPLRLRGKAISVTTAANWAMASVVGKLFPIVSDPAALNLSGTFFLFAAFCFLATVVTYGWLPETANVTLEEVDDIFASHRPKIMRATWREARRDSILDARIAKSTVASTV